MEDFQGAYLSKKKAQFSLEYFNNPHLVFKTQ